MLCWWVLGSGQPIAAELSRRDLEVYIYDRNPKSMQEAVEAARNVPTHIASKGRALFQYFGVLEEFKTLNASLGLCSCPQGFKKAYSVLGPPLCLASHVGSGPRQGCGSHSPLHTAQPRVPSFTSVPDWAASLDLSCITSACRKTIEPE